MSSQLGIYTRTGGKTYLCSSCDRCDLKDYTGSYHVSISLPHDPDGWVVYDEAVLGEDGRTCSETYAREADEDGAETPLSVWVEAHQVCMYSMQRQMTYIRMCRPRVLPRDPT